MSDCFNHGFQAYQSMEDNDGSEDSYLKQKLECKYCFETKVHWKLTDKGWRLHNRDGTIHMCKYKERS